MISNREKIIKKFNLNTNINKFIFAKTLFAFEKNAKDELLSSVANVILNRFFYETEILEENIDIVKIMTSSIFPCWKNLKYMDSIDTKSLHFKKCLNIANLSLSGNLKDNVNYSIGFHKKDERPAWATGLLKNIIVDNFYFYNNCA